MLWRLKPFALGLSREGAERGGPRSAPTTLPRGHPRDAAQAMRVSSRGQSLHACWGRLKRGTDEADQRGWKSGPRPKERAEHKMESLGLKQLGAEGHIGATEVSGHEGKQSAGSAHDQTSWLHRATKCGWRRLRALRHNKPGCHMHGRVAANPFTPPMPYGADAAEAPADMATRRSRTPNRQHLSFAEQAMAVSAAKLSRTEASASWRHRTPMSRTPNRGGAGGGSQSFLVSAVRPQAGTSSVRASPDPQWSRSRQ